MREETQPAIRSQLAALALLLRALPQGEASSCHSAEQRNKLAPFPMKFIATKAAEQLDQQALHREVPHGGGLSKFHL